MNKRILASLLSLVMILTMLPAAHAAEESVPAEGASQEGAICICETRCTEETINMDCPICGGQAGSAACTGSAADPQEDEANVVHVDEPENLPPMVMEPETLPVQSGEGAQPLDPKDTLPPAAEPEPPSAQKGAAAPLLEVENRAENIWRVGDNKALNAAVEKIKEARDKDGLTEATIALTADIKLEQLNKGDDEAGDNYFAGIEGVTVTLTSAGKAPGEPGFQLSNLGLSDGNQFDEGRTGLEDSAKRRFLVGPIVFDQITLMVRENEWYFAQGNSVVFTKNFVNRPAFDLAPNNWTSRYAINIVGGTLGTRVRQMGTGFEGRKEPGKNDDGGKSAVKSFGGDVVHPEYGRISNAMTACGETNIEIYGGYFENIIGGSYNGYVMGDTNVTVALDPDETCGYVNRHNAGVIYGGNVLNETRYGKEPGEGEWSACVWGDTHVNALSGTFGDIYGGNSAHFSSNRDDDMGEIRGDTYVTVGSEKGKEARFSNVFGGGIRSKIGQKVKILDEGGWYKEYRYFGGNTHVTINNTAVGILSETVENGVTQFSVVADVHGGGDMDLIWGTTEVILNGGKQVNWVFAGGSNSDYDRQARILNMIPDADGEIPQTAAHIVVNGGTWKEIYSCHEMYVGTKKMQWIRGDVVVDFNGGKVNSFCLSGPRTAIGITDRDYIVDKLGSSSGSEAPASVEADSILNIHGGKFGNSVPAIRGYRYGSYEGNTDAYGRVTGKRIVNFLNSISVSLWGIQSIDEINVDNTAEAVVKWYNEAYPALDRCVDLNISKGTIALAGKNTLKGNLTIQQGGTLALPTAKTSGNVPNAVLNCEQAEGLAGGLATIDVVQDPDDGYLIPQNDLVRPTKGEVYVRANGLGQDTETDVIVQPETSGNSKMLNLVNQVTDLYVEYTKDSTAASPYQHAWRIAAGAADQFVTVVFWKYQNEDGSWVSNETDQQVEIGESLGNLPAEPTREGYEFVYGTLTENGAGLKFTAETEITDAMVDQSGVVNVYGQWLPIITFDANGGAWDDKNEKKKQTADKDGRVTLPAEPTNGNQTFQGWYTEKDGGSKVDFKTATFTKPETLYAHWKQGGGPAMTVQVNFLPGAHGKLNGQSTFLIPAGSGLPTVPAVSADSGWQFVNWQAENGVLYSTGQILALTFSAARTFTAQYQPVSGGGGTGGGGGSTHYILHYESNGGTEYQNEQYNKNTVVPLNKVPTREGYTFTGWYADKELSDRITQIKMTSDKTVYAGWRASGVPAWLNGKDHFAYIIGYADGTVRPLDQISRAEVAVIFFRLLDSGVREENLMEENSFADIRQGMWCNTAISTIAQLGIVKGRTPERFDPNAPITRAEFAAICARFDHYNVQTGQDFTDIASHWAKEEIGRAAALGWIRGYTDGTFRPDNPITRAEAMTMINRMLQRLPEDREDLLASMRVWPDNRPDDWHYLAVQEATNSHDFTRKDDGVHEYWVQLTADPDWTQYQ